MTMMVTAGTTGSLKSALGRADVRSRQMADVPYVNAGIPMSKKQPMCQQAEDLLDPKDIVGTISYQLS
jgi:hypothetical protein